MEKNKTRVIFSTKAYASFDEIMKNFSLEENSEETIKKHKEKKASNFITLNDLIKKKFLGEISDGELLTSLQKETGLEQSVSQNLFKEIIEKIIPFLEKTSDEETTSINNVNKKDYLDNKQIVGAKKEVPNERIDEPLQKAITPKDIKNNREDNYREKV